MDGFPSGCLRNCAGLVPSFVRKPQPVAQRLDDVDLRLPRRLVHIEVTADLDWVSAATQNLPLAASLGTMPLAV
jgi:hypothetical protein